MNVRFTLLVLSLHCLEGSTFSVFVPAIRQLRQPCSVSLFRRKQTTATTGRCPPLRATEQSSSSVETDSHEQFVSDRLKPFDLQVESFAGQGNGLVSTRDRQAGDLLLSVPASDALCSRKLVQSGTQLKTDQPQQVKESNLSDEMLLTLELLRLRRELDLDRIKDPFLRYYLDSLLPQRQFSLLSADFPFDLIHSDKQCLPSTYISIVSHCREHAMETLYQQACDRSSDTLSLDDFLWALTTVRSRSVATYDDNTTSPMNGGLGAALLPIFDLLNHQYWHNATIAYNVQYDRYDIFSSRNVSQGQQVFISYNHDKDNLQMLLDYGFCAVENPNRFVYFDLEEMLLAAQQVLPNIFPNAILDMYKQQQEEAQQGSKQSSTLGTLYTFDACTYRPKPCLTSQLATLQALAERLAEDRPLPGLDQAILKRLLSKRQATLRQCLSNTHQVEETIESEWIPLLASIRTLLKEELGWLSR